MAELKDKELERVTGGIGRGYGSMVYRLCPYCGSKHQVSKDQTTMPKSLSDSMAEGFFCSTVSRIFFVESAPGVALKNYYDQSGQLIGSGGE